VIVMAALTDGLKNLQRQLDAAFPHRHRPDGWIGDAAHRGRTSSHNPDDTPGSKPAWSADPDSLAEVRALDVDADLGPDVSSQQLVDHLIRLPKLSTVVRYLIHKGRIYHARTGFLAERHTGAPHDGHIHFEGAWSQAGDNNATFDYRLEEITMPSAAEIATEVVAQLTKVSPQAGAGNEQYDTNAMGRAVLDKQSVPNPFRGGKTPAWALLYDLAQAVKAQGGAAAQTLAAVTELAGRDLVDEPAIAAAVLAGLPASAIVAAIPPDLARQVVDELTARLAA
jgi:hypothetical protein